MNSHEKYLELCAASTAGELTRDEQKILEAHLAICAPCRQAKREFEATLQRAVPALAEELAPRLEQPDPSWSVEQAEAALFRRLDSGRNSPRSTEHSSGRAEREISGRRFTYRPSQIPWAELWMPIAACAILAVALGIVAYRSGPRRGADPAEQKLATTDGSAGSLEEQISDFGHEKAQLMAKLAEDGRTIQDFKLKLAQQTSEIDRLKALEGSSGEKVRDVGESAGTASPENSHRDGQLAAAQASLQELQAKTDALNREREQAAGRASMLEAKVDELSKLARDREQALDEQQAEIAKQQDLLDHDRDIRELMGARELYIAEVHDVAGTGKTDKTYGRVFYTKGKSLIFYAYDLDAQPGVRDASSFQAWGRRGPDKAQALNLGMFYEDNASKKRWVLKAEDPKTLADIDAVFVTMEPTGGSHHPSGKPLLFAYLRVNPNHP
jgi:hypothetical protein